MNGSTLMYLLAAAAIAIVLVGVLWPKRKKPTSSSVYGSYPPVARLTSQAPTMGHVPVTSNKRATSPVRPEETVRRDDGVSDTTTPLAAVGAVTMLAADPAQAGDALSNDGVTKPLAESEPEKTGWMEGGFTGGGGGSAGGGGATGSWPAPATPDDSGSRHESPTQPAADRSSSVTESVSYTDNTSSYSDTAPSSVDPS